MYRRENVMESAAARLYFHKMSVLLEADLPVSGDNPHELNPRSITLADSARPVWEPFYNSVERELRQDGKYVSIHGLANKAGEHVLRERCPEICELFTQRNWELPKSIGRVYDSSLAQKVLGWQPVHGFDSVVQMLDAQIPEVLPEHARVHQVSE